MNLTGYTGSRGSQSEFSGTLVVPQPILLTSTVPREKEGEEKAAVGGGQGEETMSGEEFILFFLSNQRIVLRGGRCRSDIFVYVLL